MKIKAILLTLFLFSLPLVSAYNGFGYGWFSPSQLLDNEWVFFGLIFIVFFAIIFFSLSKTFSKNLIAAAVIAAVMAFFAAATISYRTRFYGYIGENIGNWILSILLIILFILFVKAVVSIMGGWTLFASLIGLWYLVNKIDIYDLIPYGLSDVLLPIYEFIASGTFLFLIVIASIIAVISAIKNKIFRKWFFTGKTKSKLNFRGIAEEIFGGG